MHPRAVPSWRTNSRLLVIHAHSTGRSWCESPASVSREASHASKLALWKQRVSLCNRSFCISRQEHSLINRTISTFPWWFRRFVDLISSSGAGARFSQLHTYFSRTDAPLPESRRDARNPDLIGTACIPTDSRGVSYKNPIRHLFLIEGSCPPLL